MFQSLMLRNEASYMWSFPQSPDRNIMLSFVFVFFYKCIRVWIMLNMQMDIGGEMQINNTGEYKKL